jgi:glutathione peroxidase
MAALYDIPVKDISGKDTSLKAFEGKVVLVVNVASKCGLTKQYEGLEKLYEAHKDKGFVVAGFPSNDFGQQEPGSNADIQSFCTLNFGVKFPMFEKITVVGANKHPLYRALTAALPRPSTDFEGKLKGYGIQPNPAPEILWNFEKFLISRSGDVVKRFSPETPPDDAALVKAVGDELAKA